MSPLKELKAILEEIGPERIRRPVYVSGNRLLADSIADDRDGNPEDFASVDFTY